MPEIVNCYLISSIMGEGYNFNVVKENRSTCLINLVIDDAPNLKTLYIRPQNIRHLSIANCPLLENVYMGHVSLGDALIEVRLDNLPLLAYISACTFKSDGSIDSTSSCERFPSVHYIDLSTPKNLYITNVPKFDGGMFTSEAPAVPRPISYSSRREEGATAISDAEVDAVGEGRSAALVSQSRAVECLGREFANLSSQLKELVPENSPGSENPITTSLNKLDRTYANCW